MMGDEKKQKRILRAFSVASFLNDLGSDMLYPVMPLYLAALGAGTAFIGFLDGLGVAVVSLAQLASGYLSDRLGRRKVFVWSGYLAGALGKLGFGLARTPAHTVGPRVVDRLGKVRGAPRDAMLSEAFAKEERGRAFGVLRAMDHSGAFTGALLTWLLVNTLPLSWIFYIAAVPCAAAALVILAAIPESRTKREPKKILFRRLDRNSRLFLLFVFTASLGLFSFSLLLIFAQKTGVPAGMIPLLYLAMTVTAALASYPAGRLLDRLGRRPVLLLALVTFILLCLAGLSGLSGWWSAILLALYGLSVGLFEPALSCAAVELVPEELRGTILGTTRLAAGLAALPASWLAGWLWEAVGAWAAFLVAGAFVSVALIILPFVKITAVKREKARRV
ncbi:MAG TPA: MFS transporter [Candidatus Coatesbacteria bacterium]|nr:MFS transporter [Candidatus Coatesbacteria bacterium]